MLKLKKGFTLIELLVVIAIIAILAIAVYFIASRARSSAQVAAIRTQVHNIGNAIDIYKADHAADCPAFTTVCDATTHLCTITYGGTATLSGYFGGSITQKNTEVYQAVISGANCVVSATGITGGGVSTISETH